MAKAIAEGKAKVTVADLDRLIRLEEFLREEKVGEQTKLIVEWHGTRDPREKQNGDEGGSESEGQ